MGQNDYQISWYQGRAQDFVSGVQKGGKPPPLPSPQPWPVGAQSFDPSARNF